MLKKIAIASVAVLALAGCASTKSADPAPAPAPAADSYVSPEDVFLADVHSMNDPYIESTTDSNLLDIGTATCTALDEGNTIDEIVTYLIQSGTFSTAEQAKAAGMIIAAAGLDLCPEYASDVQAYANSLSS